MKHKRGMLSVCLLGSIAVIIVNLACDFLVTNFAKGKAFSEIDSIKNKVGLLYCRANRVSRR